MYLVRYQLFTYFNLVTRLFFFFFSASSFMLASHLISVLNIAVLDTSSSVRLLGVESRGWKQENEKVGI